MCRSPEIEDMSKPLLRGGRPWPSKVYFVILTLAFPTAQGTLIYEYQVLPTDMFCCTYMCETKADNAKSFADIKYFSTGHGIYNYVYIVNVNTFSGMSVLRIADQESLSVIILINNNNQCIYVEMLLVVFRSLPVLRSIEPKQMSR